VLEIDVGDFSEFARSSASTPTLICNRSTLSLSASSRRRCCSVRKGMPCFILESCRQITTAANLANITE
jgi:hypothetical protein